jgi:hypothetical protein
MKETHTKVRHLIKKSWSGSRESIDQIWQDGLPHSWTTSILPTNMHDSFVFRAACRINVRCESDRNLFLWLPTWILLQVMPSIYILWGTAWPLKNFRNVWFDSASGIIHMRTRCPRNHPNTHQIPQNTRSRLFTDFADAKGSAFCSINTMIGLRVRLSMCISDSFSPLT